ncbi:ABC-type nitrate/sulfonate/bicarbonate transport system, permease component [Opitutaceae bacterium TAV1]|nr:ABC-type nitrate/sulfonate/bicarbonate transport system, permease component [Opitutaceae bacterium TAV1]
MSSTPAATTAATSATTVPSTRPESSGVASRPRGLAAAPVTGGRKWYSRIKAGYAVPVILPIAILAIWQLATSRGWAPPILLPRPERVFNTARDLFADGTLFNDFITSITIVIQGFAWGSSIGLVFGAWAGLSRHVERFFGPTFDAIRAVPPLAILPLIILWWGVGDLGKVIVISKTVFFPVFLNTVQGIRSVQKEYVEVGHVFRLTRWQFVRKIIVPGALPSILVGVRFAAGLSWAMIIAAEMLSGHEGLGYLIQRAQDLLFTDQMFVAIFVIAAFGLGLDLILRRIERRLLRWKQGYVG